MALTFCFHLPWSFLEVNKINLHISVIVFTESQAVNSDFQLNILRLLSSIAHYPSKAFYFCWKLQINSQIYLHLSNILDEMLIFPSFSRIKSVANAGSWLLRCSRVEAMAEERKQKTESMGKERLSFVQITGSQWQKKKVQKTTLLLTIQW